MLLICIFALLSINNLIYFLFYNFIEFDNIFMLNDKIDTMNTSISMFMSIFILLYYTTNYTYNYFLKFY